MLSTLGKAAAGNKMSMHQLIIGDKGYSMAFGANPGNVRVAKVDMGESISTGSSYNLKAGSFAETDGLANLAGADNAAWLKDAKQVAEYAAWAGGAAYMTTKIPIGKKQVFNPDGSGQLDAHGNPVMKLYTIGDYLKDKTNSMLGVGGKPVNSGVTKAITHRTTVMAAPIIIPTPKVHLLLQILVVILAQHPLEVKRQQMVEHRV
ncbi:hypothetical protein AGMMS50229_11140 [Campylobacterota bacterium]|nr:hypothetical protein AGMMS50229_11140 [Campylobacterota bacterium]